MSGQLRIRIVREVEGQKPEQLQRFEVDRNDLIILEEDGEDIITGTVGELPRWAG